MMFGKSLMTGVLGCLAAILAGCAASTSSNTPANLELVFPPAPEKPRYYFEQSIISSWDLEEVSPGSTFRGMVTGEARKPAVGLAKPFDVSVCQGQVFVSDTVSRSIRVFDFPRGEFREIGAEQPGMLRKPMGIATDGACNLYVMDSGERKVMRYDESGRFLGAIGYSDQFFRPSHLAVTPSADRIFVVDTGGVDTEQHVINVFDGANGELLYQIGGRGKEDGQFNLPRDIELGPDGRLYVVDTGNFRVQVFEQDGTFVLKFGSLGKRLGQFSRPKGIGVGPDGVIAVSDASFGNVQLFSPEGQLLLYMGDRSSTPVPAGYMLPAGLDVDEDGRIYMVDQFFRKIDVYRPAGLSREEGYLKARR